MYAWNSDPRGRRDPQNPALKRRGRKPRYGDPHECAPRFETVAELDAWIAACMDPNVDHHPVTVTEAEWEWHRKNR